MTKLSVNINKIAVVRNSRGGNMPDVVRAALDIERFGADGITVHPRPDAAKCDGPNSIPLSKVREVLRQTYEIDKIVREKIDFAALDWSEE